MFPDRCNFASQSMFREANAISSCNQFLINASFSAQVSDDVWDNAQAWDNLSEDTCTPSPLETCMALIGSRTDIRKTLNLKWCNNIYTEAECGDAWYVHKGNVRICAWDLVKPAQCWSDHTVR